MMLNPSAEVSTEAVQRFGKALRTALYDKQLEEETSIIYYYDADVVLRMIYGFQQFRYSKHLHNDDRVLLVRALLSSGYLGNVFMLRPHALEIDLALRSKVGNQGKHAAGDFQKSLDAFLLKWNVREVFDELHETLKASSLEARVDVFLEKLSEVGHQSFIAIELANGNWEQRLVRLAKDGIVHFDHSRDVLRQTLKNPIVWELRDIIGEARRRTRANLSESILRDATALALIHDAIQSRRVNDDAPLVRFYTETDVLRRAWITNDRLRELLSYEEGGSDFEGEDDLRFVVRDTDYFIIRASLDGLSFPHLKVRRGRDPQVDLKALKLLDEELSEVLNEREHGDLADFLDVQQLGSHPLRDYVEQFSSLSFLNSIWLRYHPPEQMQKNISGLREVWAFAQTGDSGRVVRERIRSEKGQVRKKLRDTVKDLHDWYQLFQSIRESSDALLRERTKEYQVPDPIKDLGLVRWGITLSEEALQEFHALIRPLLAVEDEDWWRGCADLTDLVRSVDANFERCALACSLLWSLSNFGKVDGVIEQYGRTASNPLPANLRLLSAAAKVQTASLSCEEKDVLLSNVHRVIDALPDAERSRLLVGLGYVYFHSWQSEMERKGVGTSRVEQVNMTVSGWLETSFCLGEEAVRKLDELTLYWAFAINHCTYIGAVGNLGYARFERYLERLTQLERRRELWNYRFADTLGYHYYLIARREFERLRKKANQLSALEREKIHRSLKLSLDVYTRAKTSFGDMEITTHRSQVIQFALDTGYADSSGASQPHRIPPFGDIL